ncbi:MAG TPA: M43 family zinc metalloprotease [Niastella sp.]|nr:M43 family zinc metalloprotease [Niastella sp.]
MRTIASLLFLCFFMKATAQRECATQSYQAIHNTKPLQFSGTAVTINAANSINTTGVATGEKQNTVIRIPVVVHVLWNTAAQNISDAQIKSGIAALNRDFRRQNSDTINTPARFKAIAADVEIEFVLATADPIGIATTGIIRTQTNVLAFDMDDKIKFSAQGGANAWDSKSYLNIWIGNTRRLLGYATIPGGAENIDGLVINYTAFGTINTAAPYNLGRTVVHETGHWLGLQHIWGDQACGDDEVSDTPPQAGYTSGCPTGFRSSCNNGAAGDMFMNYMDFTNDACMNLFTLGQKARMRSLFQENGTRHLLLNSKGLNLPWQEEAPLAVADTTSQVPFFTLYPNPAVQQVSLQFETQDKMPAGFVYLLDATGIALQKIAITSAKQQVNVTGLKPGVYFVKGVVNNKAISQKLVKL